MYGMLGHIGISFQQSYGTAYTDSLHYFPFISESITEEIEALNKEGLVGRFDEGDHVEGAHNINGDINIELPPETAGVLLKAWMGHCLHLQ
jgi:hypothetical protein